MARSRRVSCRRPGRLPRGLERVVRRLSRRLLLDRPVEIRVVRRIPGGGWGLCEVREGAYVIYVARTRAWSLMQHTLVHEWAHARVWKRKGDHTRPWSRAYVLALADEYARCYRVAIGD